MPVDVARLMGRISQLARIGATPHGGVTRLALSAELRQAESQVREWMDAAGLTSRFDAAGNLIGRREGSATDLPCLMLASHIDTVVNGGWYDGALGVLTAIEVAQALREDGMELEPPLEVVSFVDEEGARWHSGFFGSRAMTGTIDPAVLLRKDRDGMTIEIALRAHGLDPALLSSAARSNGEIGAYLELHIEQGAVLEARNVPLGVVTSIAGTLSLSVQVQGRADHAGATPMGEARRDALAGAAQMVLAAERLARVASPTAVATVGQMEVSPNVSNVIPGEVTFSLDLREIYESTRDLAEASLRAEFFRIAGLRKLQVEIKEQMRAAPVPIPQSMVDLVSTACGSAGVTPLRLPSGAGHDAQIMSRATEAGMLFVRCRGGVSHSPEEFVDPADVTLAAEALYAAVQLAAKRISQGGAVR